MRPLNECHSCCCIADYGVKSLVNLSSRCVGERGTRGQSKHCHGANADNTVVYVSASTNSLLSISRFVQHEVIVCHSDFVVNHLFKSLIDFAIMKMMSGLLPTVLAGKAI